jgi:hypothetical protein
LRRRVVVKATRDRQDIFLKLPGEVRGGGGGGELEKGEDRRGRSLLGFGINPRERVLMGVEDL